MFPSRNPMDACGLLVAGAHAKSGKTVVCTGLAGILRDVGFPTQPIKPLCFQPDISIRKGYEQAFFNKIIGTLQPVETLFADSPFTLRQQDWQHIMDTCRRRRNPYILEAPGSVASPIGHFQGQPCDAVDLSNALEIPLLLTVSRQPDIIAVMTPILAHLKLREAQVAGWLAVENSPIATPDWDIEVLLLRKQHAIPYLGMIAYSPSISVEACQQGNLFRLTEAGVDLLPIQQAMNLRVPI